MTINLDTLRKRAELPNALHGCTSNPCGSVVCQTARDRDELLSRLEQAEQAVARVREMHERIPVVVNDRWEIDHCKFCYEQDFSSDDAVWPCPTIRALDGHTKQLGGTPTGELADVCSCGKSYWPCTALDGDTRG